MSENIEVGNLVAKISFDDTGLSKSMAEIDRQMKLVKSEFDKASSSLKGYGSEEEKLKKQSEALNHQMQLQQQRVNKLNEEFQKAAKEKGEDARETQNLAVKLNQAETAYNNLENELKQVNIELEEQQKKAKDTSSEWDKLGEKLKEAGTKFKEVGKEITEVGKGLSKYVTAPIVGLGALSAKAAIDFESAFAGVRKTVDATEEQFAELEKGMREMAQVMPASASEIALVGEAAGQLGIKTESLLGFTEVMIGLGEATTMSSDQAATELARLANITKMNQSDFDKLGSSIVALGNNFATTEGEITSMALRLAGAGSQIGMSEADILGLATALSSVGIEAEMGGSAMSRVMVRMQVAASTGMTKVQEMVDKTGISLRDMQLMAANAGMDFADLSQSLGMTKQELKNIINAGVDLENFSKIAGITSEDFKKAFEQDAVGALGAFINGLGNAEEAGESAINMLQEMGITEIRLRDSLLRAGNANELFAESVRISNDAWEENVALSNEVAQRYGTTESQLKMLKNSFMEVAMQIGDILIPVIRDMIDFIKPMIEKFGEMDESVKKTIIVIAGIAAAIGPVLIVIGQVVSAIGSLMPVISSLGPVIAALSGPVGWIIGAIAGITAALVVLYNKNDEFRAFVNETWEEIKVLFQEVWQEIVSFVQPLVEDFSAFLKDTFAELGIFWEEHGETIMKFVKVWLTGLVGYIKFQFEAIKMVISIAWTLIKNTITTVIEGIKLVISTFLDVVLGLFRFWTKILQGDWAGAWDEIKKIAESIVGNIVTFFKNIDLVQVGKDIINGLIKGIGSMASAVADTVKGIANNITDGIKDVLKIKSPSKVTTELGEWTGKGLAVGMENSLSSISQQAKQLATATIPDIQQSGYSTNLNGSSVGSGSVFNFEGLFSGASFSVRSDADIKALAIELAKEMFSMQQIALRGVGVR